ncbi:MAG: ATP-binding protein [Thermodesulfobacteriota bacterium]|nr:ATP-binding protein [Thermodesulfobacteriota bacterium]
MLVDKKYISVRFSQTKLKARHKELAVLHDIASDLTSSLSLTEILDRAIIKVREHFQVDAVRIYLMDETEENLELVAYKGLSKRQVEGLRNIPIGKGFSGKAARTRSFVAQKVSDLENGERSAFLSGKGFKVIICVPLIVKDRVVGVMNLAAKRLLSLNERKIDLLVAIGSQIAIATNVAKLHDDLWKKAEEIREKKEALEFFAYTIAHDLKNPAVGISGFARLLANKYEDRLDEKGKKYCEQIREAAQRIETFTRDINEYIRSNRFPFEIRRINIKRILGHIRRDVAPVLKERNIAWSEPQTIPEIMADHTAITRVFRNLIDNALKHAGDKLTRIAIGYDQDQQHHIFSFSNDGAAIREKDSEAVFKVFQKLPSSGQTEGSGLGLAIVKEIAEAHRGNVWLESGAKKGTTFYISISKALEAAKT